MCSNLTPPFCILYVISYPPRKTALVFLLGPRGPRWSESHSWEVWPGFKSGFHWSPDENALAKCSIKPPSGHIHLHNSRAHFFPIAAIAIATNGTPIWRLQEILVFEIELKVITAAGPCLTPLSNVVVCRFLFVPGKLQTTSLLGKTYIYIILYTYICISSSFAKHQLRYREEKAHENTSPSLHSGLFWFHVLVKFSQLNQFWTNFTMLILNQPRKYLVYDGGIPASNHTVQLFGTFWLEKAHYMARPFHHTVWRQCLARQPRHILGHPQENGAFPCRKDICFFPKNIP